MIEWIVNHKDFAEALSFWATAFGTSALVVAGIWGIWKYFQDRKQQIMFRARDLYDNYLLIGMENPEYFLDYWKRADISELDRERYACFVAYLLNSLEDILLIDERPEWKESIRLDLMFHKSYIESEYFGSVKHCYFKEMREILDQVIHGPRMEIKHA